MDGLLIIDKPAGWTSHDVVARARRVLREKRIGHTGTLDPFATGVLVLLVGRATRLAQFLSGAVKEYEAVVRFGYATDTGDLTGARRGDAETFEPCRVWSEKEIETALASLRGELEQVPPMYSAKKVKGQKLYDLARQGIEVERQPVRVTIHELEATVKDVEGLLSRRPDGTCDLGVRVVCSAGTYVRTLAEAIGERLGASAHLAELRRTRAGAFSLERAVTLDKLNETAEARTVGALLISMNAALREMPVVHLTDQDARRARHGAALGAADTSLNEGEYVRLCDAAGELIAIGVYDAERGALRPRVMLAAEDG
ncbi:MAG: tRNA pseudouridine(55) synthase TruB [Pyrinomonadaceae bacterium]